MILADAGSAFQDAATSGPLLLALGPARWQGWCLSRRHA
ncbi:hypothetical protein I543_4314 [Mycobacteroides abscessus 21]|uniref:Uncharacterized protein n=1 Tax=Mycobacteroides abscessus 21 TaxID=1299324 RepID=A0A829Q3K9_9MYCO|nr:hypothetical protein I543_4314 [Mycobacteroides abscessus 21]